MKVADLMTPDPLTVEPSDTIELAEQIMEEHKVRQLPVVRGTDLVGIITDRDIRSFLSGRLFATPEEREQAMNTKIDSVMTTKPIFLSPEDDLIQAIEIFIEEKIGGIPIVDEEERLVGILTYVDVLRGFLDFLQEE